jgi:hypothetical protein
MISINHLTSVITIPKADTTYVETNATTGYEIRSYDEYAFMRELADYMDSEAGAVLPNIFNHNTSVTIAGVVYARALVILSPYTVTFESGTYQVKLVGGMNNNMLDVLNPNSVSVIAANSAGLQTVTSGSGVTAGDKTDIINGVWAKTIETMTAEEMIRVMAAVLAGKVSGAGTGTETFKGIDGTTNRVVSTVDVDGNRTAITLNGA